MSSKESASHCLIVPSWEHEKNIWVLLINCRHCTLQQWQTFKFKKENNTDEQQQQQQQQQQEHASLAENCRHCTLQPQWHLDRQIAILVYLHDDKDGEQSDFKGHELT